MRMKKLILFAAMAAMAVSCAKTSEVNPVSEQAIGFDTWTSNLTKSTHAAFPVGATFNVFGYKEKNSVLTTVFDGDVVTLKSDASWGYNNIRMWDRTQTKYTFFAIAPAGLLGENPSPSPAQNGHFVTEDITFDGKYPDVLIAQKKEVVAADYGKPVDLVFKPQAALFDLKFKKAKNLKEASLKINSVSINNIETKGNITVSNYDGNKNPVITWNLADPSVKGSFNHTNGNVEATVPVTIPVNVEHGTGNSQFLINNLVVMPQTLIDGGQQLVINYTITFSGQPITHEVTVDLNKFDITDMQDNLGRDEASQNGDDAYITAWEPGKHYTYYLTINADLISFTATISDWTDQDAFHYIIN